MMGKKVTLETICFKMERISAWISDSGLAEVDLAKPVSYRCYGNEMTEHTVARWSLRKMIQRGLHQKPTAQAAPLYL